MNAPANGERPSKARSGGAYPPGLIIAAPASGSGKTVVTLGLLRHLANSGVSAGPAKAGPDYIDPAFHAAASGRTCFNLDPWAMRTETLAAAARASLGDADMVVCEGVMGLFDGAASGIGSTADLAAATGWPVVLVVDVKAQGASAAAVVRGFVHHRAGVSVEGVIFNRTGSPRHEMILRDACAAAVPGVRVLGCLPRDSHLALPERHLGLVQAGEHGDLETFLEGAAALLGERLDVKALLALTSSSDTEDSAPDARAPALLAPLAPLGQRIAVARDAAFAFQYPQVIEGWRRAGAEVDFFSPLADEGPGDAADGVYLPGGYPELHAGRLAANGRFLSGLHAAQRRGAAVYGECGGYMVLGRVLIDADGAHHVMSGLLPLVTSFTGRALHLGYRRVRLASDGPLGQKGAAFRGHEFHYARTVEEGPGQHLFECEDATGAGLGAVGLTAGRIAGSFIHLIDRE